MTWRNDLAIFMTIARGLNDYFGAPDYQPATSKPHFLAAVIAPLRKSTAGLGWLVETAEAGRAGTDQDG